MSKQDYVKDTHEFSTVLDFLRFALSEVERHQVWYGHGTDNAWDECLTLILRSLHLPVDADARLLQARLSLAERQHLTKQLERRILQRVPVPYLIHEAYFAGHQFYVDERVLIPRSPFAELIEQQFEPWVEPEKVTRILDLCTGSGCIAIACAYAFPDAQVDAVDVSADALAVAEKNVSLHEMEDHVTLIESDVWENVPKERYDLIVSNPPYVGGEEMQTLPTEYTHEPRLALEASENGLAIVHEILIRAKDYLTPEGVLVVEVGNSEEALIEAYPEVPFTWLNFERGGEGVFILTREQLCEVDSAKTI